MAKLIINKISENLWRCWMSDTPQETFTVDTVVGLCTCGETRGCIHVELVRDTKPPGGMPIKEARALAQRTLENFREDPWVSYIKVKAWDGDECVIRKIHYEIGMRGKGSPITVEGRLGNMIMVADLVFHINLPDDTFESTIGLRRKVEPAWRKVL